MTAPERTRVMVVDDDPALSRMLRILLQSEGFDVMVANNGQQALDKLTEGEPALVVLDLQMPVLDGRGFFREFRRLGHRAPVLLLSAYNSEAARDELGAEAALGKPCDPEAVAQLAQRLIRESMAPAT